MSTVIVTTKEDLDALIQVAVSNTIKDILPAIVRQATTKPFLTKQELMDLTGWSGRQVEYKKKQREIPFVRRGRLVLFPTEEVHRYLEKGYVPARK